MAVAQVSGHRSRVDSRTFTTSRPPAMTGKTNYRNRIVGSGETDPKTLIPHPNTAMPLSSAGKP